MKQHKAFRFSTAVVIGLALTAVATPALATQFAYSFNLVAPSFQQGVKTAFDQKTVYQHYGTVQFNNIQGDYKATAQMCSTVYYCGGGTEVTDLTDNGTTHHLPNTYGTSGKVAVQMRTNSITTDSVYMLGFTCVF